MGSTMARGLIPWRGWTEPLARRDELYDPFTAFRREVDRMFDDFFDGLGRSALSPFFGSWSEVTPTMDVTETEKELVITAELPGLDEKDFEVTISGDVLTLKGEKKSEREHRARNGDYVERRYGTFSRSVRLPFDVGDEKVDATYEKGVLTIRIPKPAELQRPARRIEVRAA
jgi:HSP20 family protein